MKRPRTPRQKWDLGIKLKTRELDELLAEGVLAEKALALLDETVPRTTAEIAAHLGYPVDKTAEMMRHLASEPVWLAQEAPGVGWVLGDGEPPQCSAIVLARPTDVAISLADEGPLARGSITSSYARLAAATGPTRPTM